MANEEPIGTGFFKIAADWTGLNSDLDKIRKKVEDTGGSIEKSFKSAFERGLQNQGQLLGTIGEKAGQIFGLLTSKAALAGQAVGLLALTFNELRDSLIAFNAQFTRFAVLVADSPEKIGAARQAIRDMGADLGSLGKRTEAFREAFLNIGTIKGAQSVATAALGLSGVSGTDPSSAIRAITTVMSAYNIKADEAGRVSAQLFGIFKSGGGSVEEMSYILPRVATSAAAAGIRFEELGSLLTALGSAGITSRQRMITLNEVIQLFSQNADKFSEQGVNIKRVLAEEGVAGALKALNRITGESIGELQQMGVSFQATGGMIALMRAALSGTLPTIAEVTEKEAALAMARKKQAEDYTTALEHLGSAWEELKVELAAEIVSPGTEIVKWLREMIAGTRELVELWKWMRPVVGKIIEGPLVPLLPKRKEQLPPSWTATFQPPEGVSLELGFEARAREVFNASARARRGAPGTAAPGTLAGPGGGTNLSPLGAIKGPLDAAATNKQLQDVQQLHAIERKAALDLEMLKEQNFQKELERTAELAQVKRSANLAELKAEEDLQKLRAGMTGGAPSGLFALFGARQAAERADRDSRQQDEINNARERAASDTRTAEAQLAEAKMQRAVFAQGIGAPGQTAAAEYAARGRLAGAEGGSNIMGGAGIALPEMAGLTRTVGPQGEVYLGNRGAGGPLESNLASTPIEGTRWVDKDGNIHWGDRGALAPGAGETKPQSVEELRSEYERLSAKTGDRATATLPQREKAVGLQAAVEQGEEKLRETRAAGLAAAQKAEEKARGETAAAEAAAYKERIEKVRAFYADIDRMASLKQRAGYLTIGEDIQTSLDAARRPLATTEDRVKSAIEAKDKIEKAERDLFDLRKSLLQTTLQEESNFEAERVSRTKEGTQQRLDAERAYIEKRKQIYSQQFGLAGTAIGIAQQGGLKRGSMRDVETAVEKQLSADKDILGRAKMGFSVDLPKLEQARGRINLGDQFKEAGGIGKALSTGLLSQKEFLSGERVGGGLGNVQEKLTSATQTLTGAVQELTAAMRAASGEAARGEGAGAGGVEAGGGGGTGPFQLSPADIGRMAIRQQNEAAQETAGAFAMEAFTTTINRERDASIGRNR